MRFKTKLKLTAAATVGTALAGIAISRSLDTMAGKLLSCAEVSRASLDTPKRGSLYARAADMPEFILGKLFAVTSPQINITVPSFDGTHLNAVLFPTATPSTRYAIVLHGYRSSPAACYHIAKHYSEAGYNVLVPYMRAHYGSDAEYCTMGYLERLDLVEWIRYISGRSENAQIVLHGVSMGAATVMMATGENLPSSVICAVEDCGYTTAYDIYAHVISTQVHLPAFPTLDLLARSIKRKVGLDLKEASALDAVRRSKTPTLFIHGTADTTVPVEMARTLYANAACERELAIFKNAEHGLSSLIYPEEYWKRVFAFVERYSK